MFLLFIYLPGKHCLHSTHIFGIHVGRYVTYVTLAALNGTPTDSTTHVLWLKVQQSLKFTEWLIFFHRKEGSYHLAGKVKTRAHLLKRSRSELPTWMLAKQIYKAFITRQKFEEWSIKGQWKVNNTSSWWLICQDCKPNLLSTGCNVEMLFQGRAHLQIQISVIKYYSQWPYMNSFSENTKISSHTQYMKAGALQDVCL